MNLRNFQVMRTALDNQSRMFNIKKVMTMLNIQVNLLPIYKLILEAVLVLGSYHPASTTTVYIIQHMYFGVDAAQEFSLTDRFVGVTQLPTLVSEDLQPPMNILPVNRGQFCNQGIELWSLCHCQCQPTWTHNLYIKVRTVLPNSDKYCHYGKQDKNIPEFCHSNSI